MNYEIEKSELKKLFEYYSDLANKRHAWAQTWLADAYFWGWGTTSDYRKFLEWDIKAARNGSYVSKRRMVLYSLSLRNLSAAVDATRFPDAETVISTHENSYPIEVEFSKKVDTFQGDFCSYLSDSSNSSKLANSDVMQILDDYEKTINESDGIGYRAYGEVALSKAVCYIFGFGIGQDLNAAMDCLMKFNDSLTDESSKLSFLNSFYDSWHYYWCLREAGIPGKESYEIFFDEYIYASHTNTGLAYLHRHNIRRALEGNNIAATMAGEAMLEKNNDYSNDSRLLICHDNIQALTFLKLAAGEKPNSAATLDTIELTSNPQSKTFDWNYAYDLCLKVESELGSIDEPAQDDSYLRSKNFTMQVLSNAYARLAQKTNDRSIKQTLTEKSNALEKAGGNASNNKNTVSKLNNPSSEAKTGGRNNFNFNAPRLNNVMITTPNNPSNVQSATANSAIPDNTLTKQDQHKAGSCSKCGARLNEHDRFCKVCGTPVSTSPNNISPVSNSTVSTSPVISTPVGNPPANTPQIRKCVKCDSKLNEHDRFCKVCGTPVNTSPNNSTPVNNSTVNTSPVSSSPVSTPPANTPQIRRCAKCDSKLNEHDRFCKVCGTPVNTSPDNTTPVNTSPANSSPVSTPPPADTPQIKKCVKCGNGLKEHDRFCKVCGTPVSTSPDNASQVNTSTVNTSPASNSTIDSLPVISSTDNTSPADTTQIKKCVNCGNVLKEHDRFCKKCGTPVSTSPATTSTESNSTIDSSPVNSSTENTSPVSNPPANTPPAKKCSNCGYELRERDRFCKKCGTPFNAPSSDTVSTENKEPPVEAFVSITEENNNDAAESHTVSTQDEFASKDTQDFLQQEINADFVSETDPIPYTSQNIDQIKNDADNGDPKAQYILASMYDTGKGVTKDTSEALKWYARSAGQDFADSLYALAKKYENGDGINKDQIMAIALYQKAADQGHRKSSDALNRLL